MARPVMEYAAPTELLSTFQKKKLSYNLLYDSLFESNSFLFSISQLKNLRTKQTHTRLFQSKTCTMRMQLIYTTAFTSLCSTFISFFNLISIRYSAQFVLLHLQRSQPVCAMKKLTFTLDNPVKNFFTPLTLIVIIIIILTLALYMNDTYELF